MTKTQTTAEPTRDTWRQLHAEAYARFAEASDSEAGIGAYSALAVLERRIIKLGFATVDDLSAASHAYWAARGYKR